MSLLFPVGVVSSNGHDDDEDDEDDKLAAWKFNAIHERVNQCEKRKLSKQKEELMLDNLKLTADDIPIPLLHDTALGKTLYTLTLCGNPLQTIPDRLVMCLPELRVLDLQQCDVRSLPEHWNLPRLTTLDLSHNLLTGFPDEDVLRGLPQLRTLNLFNNRISQITLPADPSLLSSLQILDVGSNQLEWLPDKLDQLASLLLLKVMNNRIQVVSRRICEIPTLREIDGLISNDMVMPPKSECAWGLCRMKRYYNQLAIEEERKKQAKDCPRRSSYKTL